MKNRLLCVLLILITFVLMLFGCSESESEAYLIINKDSFTLGVLLRSDKTYSDDVLSGVKLAHSLAGSVRIDESVSISYVYEYYNNADDVSIKAQKLFDNGAAALVFCGEDYDSFLSFSEFARNAKLPVAAISPFEPVYDGEFSLSLTPEYMSSATATYAMNSSYESFALLAQDSSDYYTDFAEVFNSTLKSYTGSEATAYFLSGECENYSRSAFLSGNYDFLFLLADSANSMLLVSDLRSGGFEGKIMLTEVLDKASFATKDFDNCTFVSKLESDSSNNISTVFYSMYSENIAQSSNCEASPAAAYGYDAYMTVYEALKSFADSSTDLLSDSESTRKAQSLITNEDLIEALNKADYAGVTDRICFNNNRCVTTYIYVDDIINGECVFNSKYTFTAD